MGLARGRGRRVVGSGQSADFLMHAALLVGVVAGLLKLIETEAAILPNIEDDDLEEVWKRCDLSRPGPSSFWLELLDGGARAASEGHNRE